MKITVECPFCNEKLDVMGFDEDSEVRCPTCQQTFSLDKNMCLNEDDMDSEDDSEEDVLEEEDSDEDKGSMIGGLIGELCVFAWNSYVIANNITAGDGYRWVVIGAIVNLILLFSIPWTVYKIWGKTHAWVAVSLCVLIFIIGGMIGCSSTFGGAIGWSDLEREAKSLIVEKLDSGCTRVKILRNMGDNCYYAVADFRGGGQKCYVIEYFPQSHYISVTETF